MSQPSSVAVRSLRERLKAIGPHLQAKVARGELTLEQAETAKGCKECDGIMTLLTEQGNGWAVVVLPGLRPAGWARCLRASRC
jgi:hypothetical protein